jgi:ribosome-binding factor A
MPRNPSKSPSQRQLRVGERIRHILSETLARGHFGHDVLVRHAHELSISEVRASPDLKYARAYVATFLDGINIDEVLKALNDDARFFQADISKSSNLKFTPRVVFVKDDSLEEVNRIDEILRQVRTSSSDDDSSETE